MNKPDKKYHKTPRSVELSNFIESYWARPIKMCDKIMIDMAEEQYIKVKMIDYKSKLINEMYCIK